MTSNKAIRSASHTRVLPVEVHTQVPVRREEALIQVVQLVVVLHEQL